MKLLDLRIHRARGSITPDRDEGLQFPTRRTARQKLLFVMEAWNDGSHISELGWKHGVTKVERFEVEIRTLNGARHTLEVDETTTVTSVKNQIVDTNDTSAVKLMVGTTILSDRCAHVHRNPRNPAAMSRSLDDDSRLLNYRRKLLEIPFEISDYGSDVACCLF